MLSLFKQKVVPPPIDGPKCYVCGTPADLFVDFNGPRRKCSGCGATERHRLFAAHYDNFIRDEFDLAGKSVLLVAPIAIERRLFAERNITDFKTIDANPKFKADYQADLCNMPEVPSGEFDAVYASFVLACVYDLDACLSEIRRVLKPGGRFFSCDPVTVGRPTVEQTDVEKITYWYGRDLYDKYKIGNYRSFGDVDLIAKLQEFFVVKTYHGIDVGAGSKAFVWSMGIKTATSHSRDRRCITCNSVMTEEEVREFGKDCEICARAHFLISDPNAPR